MDNVVSYAEHLNNSDHDGKRLISEINRDGGHDGDIAYVVRMMLENGVDPNYRTGGEFTPLHFAAMRGKPKTLKVLLEFGADPNINSATLNLSPLWMAVAYANSLEHKECAKILINLGVDMLNGFDSIDELSRFFFHDLSWMEGKNAKSIDRIHKTKKLFKR